MKKVFLVRHAESEANVVKAIYPHDNIIKITGNGKTQAKELSEIIENVDRVIVSKFIRTIETAEPLIRKFPEAQVHLWLDTHEFDPADTKNISHLKYEDLMQKYDFFWEKGDPFYKDAEHVESFYDFANRLNKVILKLKSLDGGANYVITHGWCIKMFMVLLNEFPNFNIIKKQTDPDLYLQIMQAFKRFDKEFKTKNTGVYEITELVEKYSQ